MNFKSIVIGMLSCVSIMLSGANVAFFKNDVIIHRKNMIDVDLIRSNGHKKKMLVIYPFSITCGEC